MILTFDAAKMLHQIDENGSEVVYLHIECEALALK